MLKRFVYQRNFKSNTLLMFVKFQVLVLELLKKNTIWSLNFHLQKTVSCTYPIKPNWSLNFHLQKISPLTFKMNQASLFNFSPNNKISPLGINKSNLDILREDQRTTWLLFFKVQESNLVQLKRTNLPFFFFRVQMEVSTTWFFWKIFKDQSLSITLYGFAIRL